jgi:3'(2'), 5'-bisphosphate nucleotidase
MIYFDIIIIILKISKNRGYIMDFQKMLKVAIEAAKKAGIDILEIYKNPFEIYIKEDESPVTMADIEANRKIIDILTREYPNIAILSEESSDDISRLNEEYVWLIDPLDGTKEFIKRNGEFCVNIALSYKGQIVLGVIYAPVKNDLYYSIRGNGSFRVFDGNKIQLNVSKRIKDRRMVIGQSTRVQCVTALAHSYNIPIIRMGSALKGCMIARGDAEMHYRFGPTMEWDTGAMQIILEEAGGYFRQLDDSIMTYNRKDTKNHKGFYMLNRWENKITLE